MNKKLYIISALLISAAGLCAVADTGVRINYTDGTFRLIPSEELESIVYEKDFDTEGWNPLGQALVRDYYVGIEGYYEIYQNEEEPSKFMIENPYYTENEASDAYFKFQIFPNGGTFYLEYGNKEYSFPMTENLVGFEPFYALTYDGYDFYTMYPPLFGETFSGDYSYVVSYQDNGLPAEIHLSYILYSPAGLSFGDTSEDEMTTILFPAVNTTTPSEGRAKKSSSIQEDDKESESLQGDASQKATRKLTLINKTRHFGKPKKMPRL